MMYRLELSRTARSNMSRLDPSVERRVMAGLRRLAQNCETVRHIALTGLHAGEFRLRVGDYRALYTIDRESRRIVVELVGHRSDVY